MVTQTKTLIARLEPRWAVTQGAEARGAVEKMNARERERAVLGRSSDHGAIVVGHGS